MKAGTEGVYLELSGELLFQEQKRQESQLMSANDIKLHGEDVSAAVLV